MNFPTLYKTDNTGKVRQWSIWTTENPNGYWIEHGVQGGALQKSFTEVKTGKNSGKVNETNPKQQAESDAQSKYNRQIDKGYSVKISDKKSRYDFRPMLAQSAKFDTLDVSGFFLEKKYDGIRCLAFLDGDSVILMSRLGKRFTALKHIEDALVPILKDNFILDGEIYSDKINFQQIISAVKRDKPSELTNLIQYHVYDIYFEDRADMIFKDRLSFLNSIPYNESIKQVAAFEVWSEEDVWRYHEKFTKEGFEGVMLRDPNGEYQPDKRSKYLLKCKTFMTEEFKIVGVEQNKGKQSDQCCFVCETADGARFNVKPIGSDDIRREYFRNYKKYVGQLLTVKFFEWSKSNPPVPRFGVGLDIRNYE